MASFKAELPNDLIKSFENLESSCSQMLGEMTRAGAEKVYLNVKKNMKKSFNDSSDLEKCLKITKTYKTPSDDGVNTKVGLYGYLRNDKNKPAPFMKKSFVKSEIEQVMNKVQDKYLPKE